MTSLRKIYLSILLLIIASQVYSQVGIGLLGGPNFSTSAIYKRPEFRTRSVQNMQAFQMGAFFRYVSEKHAGMQIEFLYSRKGWSDVSAEENPINDVEQVRSIDYFEVPLMTHFIVGSKKVRIILEGGPYIAYAFSSRIDSIVVNTGEKTSYDLEFRDGIDNKWDYGLKGSAGFQFYVDFGAFEAKAFYNYGYANVFLDKSEAVETSQNRTYGINVSYIYFFKRKEKD